MKNIELQLAKPYSRDDNTPPQKVTMSAEFDDIEQALQFMRELNLLIIRFNERTKNNG